MYYEYWGMHKAPFDNVPDPALYWNANPELENSISEILFAIEEGNDCLAVMVGDIGTGKTLAMRVILNELNPDKYSIAYVTNPDLSNMQLLREIIGQLENKKVTIRYKDHLMERFNAILFECANQGKKVVIFIDEANVLSIAKLNNLRLWTNLQDDKQNMVIFVLAGQRELGKRLESKNLENLYQRIGIYCRIKGLNGPEAVRDYMVHRIQACGGSPDIFTPDAYNAVWKYSGDGTPRLINKITKLCLKAAETNHVHQINEAMVDSVGVMFEREKALKEKNFSKKAAVHPVQKPAQEIPAEAAQISQPSSSEVRLNVDQDIIHFIRCLPAYLIEELSIMQEDDLRNISNKLANQYIQMKYKNKILDPVSVWDTVKTQIFLALKSLQKLKKTSILATTCSVP